MTESKKKPTDEMCICGHLRSEHNDLDYNNPAAIGKSNCSKSSCGCPRFTWSSFVYGTYPIRNIFPNK